MAYDPNAWLPNQGAWQPSSGAGTPRYGTGPGDLGMADPQGLTGMPGAPSMGFPAMAPPATSMAPSAHPSVLRGGSPASSPNLSTAPMPPPRPAGLGQRAQPQAAPQQGSLWDALRALFSGGQQAQVPTGSPQGMTAMLRGQGARGIDSLGNPVGRF